MLYGSPDADCSGGGRKSGDGRQVGYVHDVEDHGVGVIGHRVLQRLLRGIRGSCHLLLKFCNLLCEGCLLRLLLPAGLLHLWLLRKGEWLLLRTLSCLLHFLRRRRLRLPSNLRRRLS